MVVDTGASRTLISEKTWNNLGSPRLGPCRMQLTTYTGSTIPTIGKMKAKIYYLGKIRHASMIVTKGNGQDLLGLDLLQKFKPRWNQPIDRQEDHKKINAGLKTTPHSYYNMTDTARGGYGMEMRKFPTRLKAKMKHENYEASPAVTSTTTGTTTTLQSLQQLIKNAASADYNMPKLETGRSEEITTVGAVKNHRQLRLAGQEKFAAITKM